MNEAGEIGDEKAPPNRRQSAAGITPKHPPGDCRMSESASESTDGIEGEEKRAAGALETDGG